MSTNYLRGNLGSHVWDGYKCFRVQCNCDGIPFVGGAKYVVFREGLLIAACSTQTEADQAFLTLSYPEGLPAIRLSEFKGIQEGLR